MKRRMALMLGGSDVEILQPRELWATGAQVRSNRRAHLVKDAVRGTKYRKEFLMTSYACGRIGTESQLMFEVPEDMEPCDDCLIADFLRPTVYQFFDESEKRIYVGYSINFPARLASHRKGSEFWPLVHRFEFQEYDSAEVALAEEKRLIQLHQPPFNKVFTARYVHPRRRSVAA